ncbi:MAG: alginate lyase family protein [Elusimicrobiota bacterium]
MNTKHILHRVQNISKKNLPKLLLIKSKSAWFSFLERESFRVSSKKGDKPFFKFKSIKPLGIISKNIFSLEARDSFREKFPTEVRQIIQEADQYLDLTFNVLGSGPVDFKDFHRRSLKSMNGKATSFEGLIPWHFDFKSNVGWDSNAFYKDLKFGDVQGVDVKVPWELSRCAHFIRLGQAYYLTNDEKYVRGILSHWKDWFHQNPLYHGINWACPMDVSLRVCNWILSWEFICQSNEISDDFKKQVLESMFQHGMYIYRHLEWGGDVSTNHYLSNLQGLLYIGLFIGHDKWVSFSKKEITKALFSQTFPDGFDFEGSTAYHRLVLEMFFFSSLVLSRKESEVQNISGTSSDDLSNIRFHWGAPFVERLRLMFSKAHDLMDSQGIVPLIGDNDSGRIHSFLTHSDVDWRYLSEWGYLLFKENAFRLNDSFLSDYWWVFGHLNLNTSVVGVSSHEDVVQTKGSSGLITMKGKRDRLIFNCLPNGTRGVGNHTHNDKLSFCLSVEGDHFFVDPGTVCYTSDPDLRNRMRSTHYHSTVMIDQNEQNRFIDGSLFSLKNDAKCSFSIKPDGLRVEASHTGFKKIDGHVIHQRVIERATRELKWKIEDSFGGLGEHRLSWCFVLGPQIHATFNSAQEISLKGQTGTLQIFLKEKGLDLMLEDVPFSPAYGEVIKTKAIRITKWMQVPYRFEFEVLYKNQYDIS